MRRGVAILVAAGILAFPAAARGSTIPTDEVIAQQTWGEACSGHWSLSWAPLPTDVVGAASWQDIDGNPADYQGCHIYLSSTYHETPRERCTTLVHEWGHLTGHAHSTDPNNVMYPYIVRIFPPCRVLRTR